MPHKIRLFFRTRTSNSVLIDFLAHFQAESSLSLRLQTHDAEISLLACGNEKELASLAEDLGREIPLSIFLAHSDITAAPDHGEQTDQAETNSPEETTTVGEPARQTSPSVSNLPPCPRCLRQAEQNFQAGQAELINDCRFCSPVNHDGQQVFLDPVTGDLRVTETPPRPEAPPDPAEQAATFAQAAQLLADGKRLQIVTPAGTTVAAISPEILFSPQPSKTWEEYLALVTIPQSLPNQWLCGDDELFLLAALEKPLVKLEPGEDVQRRYKLPPRPLPVGLADDLFYWYLARHLQALEIPLLFLAGDISTSCRPLMVADKQKHWLLTGTRALFPMRLPLNFPAAHSRTPDHERFHASVEPPSACSLTEKYNGATVMASVTVRENHRAEGPARPWQPGLHLRAFQAFLATSPDNRIASSAAQEFFGISLDPDPGGMALLTVTGHGPPQIALTSSKSDAEPRQAGAILEQIAGLDAAAQRLLTNYAQGFPQRWQTLREWTRPIHVDTLSDLFGMILLICGGNEGGLEASDQCFLDLAARATPGRSPRLELIRETEQTLLDHRLLFRSALSYSLAGASPAAICRGFLESLAERLSCRIWESTTPGASPRVALCTPLCLHPAFYGAIHRQGSENFLLSPPPLPLDCLPAIGQLWDEPATLAAGKHQKKTACPSNQERRELLKNPFDLFK